MFIEMVSAVMNPSQPGVIVCFYKWSIACRTKCAELVRNHPLDLGKQLPDQDDGKVMRRSEEGPQLYGKCISMAPVRKVAREQVLFLSFLMEVSIYIFLTIHTA